jgi:SpoVK/Ycf46/Vps4 family AAA+-type ATPase
VSLPATKTAATEEALQASLAGLRERVRRAVDARRASDPEPDDPFRGLHVSDAQADRLLNDRPRLAEGAPRDQIGFEGVLTMLGGAFGLDDLDLELLLTSLAPDLDASFEPLYGYLQDDVSRRRAGIGLALELCGLSPLSAAARARFGPQSRLVRSGLVLVEDADRPFLTRPLRVPDRVTRQLLGDSTPDLALDRLTSTLVPIGGEVDPGLRAWLRAPGGLVYLREAPGGSAASILAAAAQAEGLAVLAVDVERMGPDEDPEALAMVATREAGFSRAVLLVRPVETLAARGRGAVQAFADQSQPLVMAGAVHWDPAWARRPPLICEAPALEVDTRQALWSRDLGAAAEIEAAAATRQFRLSPEQIFRAAESARLTTSLRGSRLDDAAARAAARAQNSAGLERLARRIEPAVGFADLVLQSVVLEHLRELTVRARWRERVLGEWRMGGAASRRRGLSALFAGASGTGKTMAAEVVAGEMGLDLYVVDLATVVDKYVGETEKNLDRIFAEAERINGVLLFDEADALFGKRSEVSDAHDRYANVEVAYLLQRMELFEGTAILATNLRSNLDEAFARRLDLLVDFPEPEEAERRLLWERCLGGRVPRAGDIDIGFLGQAFRLSGGNIRNICVSAAYQAADAGRAMSMADLVRATQREYRKLGRMVVEAEFGSYYYMVG